MYLMWENNFKNPTKVREVVQQLRALSLTEDTGSVLGTHMVASNNP